MLKNELEILTSVISRGSVLKANAHIKKLQDFNKDVLESCDRAIEGWAIAAFSDHSEQALRRYFTFHFNYLNALLAEETQFNDKDFKYKIYDLIDHLLIYYREFINQYEPVAIEYSMHRLNVSRLKYSQFIEQYNVLNSNIEFYNCLIESIGPLYIDAIVEPLKLGAILYREELISDLSSRRTSQHLMETDSLIAAMIAINFNHVKFLSFLRKKAINGLLKTDQSEYSSYFAQLSAEVSSYNQSDRRCYDPNLPHICVMYKDWLNDYGTLLTLTLPPNSENIPSVKVPLLISVKQLACIIRTFYEAGFYGNITLTAIFDHAATVFTTKRQEHISAESISNAYYAISQSSALKVTRLLGSCIEFLKPYCFPA